MTPAISTIRRASMNRFTCRVNSPNLSLEDTLQLMHLYFERGSPKLSRQRDAGSCVISASARACGTLRRSRRVWLSAARGGRAGLAPPASNQSHQGEHGAFETLCAASENSSRRTF